MVFTSLATRLWLGAGSVSAGAYEGDEESVIDGVFITEVGAFEVLDESPSFFVGKKC